MRVDDWEQRLVEYLHYAEEARFRWGIHDCVTFAANAVRTITGGDPIADLRGQWSDRSAAYDKMRKLGGLDAAVSARFERLPTPLLAGRGDLVLIDTGTVALLAVVVLLYAVAPKRRGLLRYAPVHWVAGWRVA